MPAPRPVEIVDAPGTWPDEFGYIAQDLRACLGELALRIDHIGSTSVPGLAAKNIIDVQITVAALDLDQLAPAFERAGFLHRADNPGFHHRPPGACRHFHGVIHPDVPGGLVSTALPDSLHGGRPGRPSRADFRASAGVGESLSSVDRRRHPAPSCA